MAVFSLLFTLAVGLSAIAAPVLGKQESCPPFSCGQLNDLTWPFRLKDHPPSCGNDMYQLSCAENRTILYIDGHMFYVTGVWYNSSSFIESIAGIGGTFWLVDPNFDNSTCHLPSLDFVRRRNYEPSYQMGWMFSQTVYFINCTKPIQNDNYILIPCLSSHNSTSTTTSSFVYAVIGGDSSLRGLMPTCRYLTSAPAGQQYWGDSGKTYDEVPHLSKLMTADSLFQILQKGFILPLPVQHYRTYRALHRCFNETKSLFLNQTRGKKFFHFAPSLVISEGHFLNCLHNYYNKAPFFKKAVAVVMSIMILQLWIVVRTLGGFLILWIYIVSNFWKMMNSSDNVEKFLQRQLQRLSPTRYTYGDIIVITRNFEEKLGQGGFGSVFKGELLGGVLVAVKMLNNSKYNGEEFISEVSTIGRIHHTNVVRLVGFCADGSKRALVYEYMVNGSLDKFIFASNGIHTQHLYSSQKLIDIALAISRGIDYLHRGCEMQILHFDIKPHNILLDSNLNPKVSDFGLAKLYPKDNSLVSVSATRGTIGYIAPELISRSFGVVSYKSDVYSFGMLLLEMAGGRKNADPLADNSSKIYYPSWIYDQLDPLKEFNHGNETKINEVERKLSIVGLWCIQLKPSDRPTMSKVIEMLEEDVDALTMPPKPFFSSMEPSSVHQSYFNSSFTDLSSIAE